MEVIKCDEEYYLKTEFGFDLLLFVEKVRANSGMKKDSFADRYVIKIVSDLLIGAVDLGKKYQKYYSMEYDTFTQYLYKKEMFDNSLIERFNLQETETIWKLRSKNDTIIGYKNENLEIINQALELFENEN